MLLFERLPVIGGEHWEDAHVSQLVREVSLGGVRMLPATQVLRWDGHSLLAVGQESGSTHVDVLVVATGHRPLTRAELGIGGSRCGRILPGTVALHLLHHHVPIGRRPIVVGGSDLALAAVSGLLEGGAERVSVLAPDGLSLPLASSTHVEVNERARPVRVDGGSGVSSVWAETPSGEHVEVSGDALVLAYGRVPYRNIDGAVVDEPGVVFAQPATDPRDDAVTEDAGTEAAARALAQAERPRQRLELPLRIGGPL